MSEQADPIRPAASIVLLRDGPTGLEVFLLRRHGEAQVLGGAYVFPGGKVDPEDAQPAALDILGTPAAQLHETLGEPERQPAEAAAIWMAALRETFEETGVLYADGYAPAHAAALAGALGEGATFVQALSRLNLRLNPTPLAPWSRWITPASGGLMRKRFDTRFFVAPVPAGQQPEYDARESTEGIWLTPREALTRWWARSIEFAPPQIMTLQHLARHAHVGGVLAEARSRKPPRIQPEPWQAGGDKGLCYPGDPAHGVAERAMPGPTRLALRHGRFEPQRGLDDLLTPAV
jgi:8-oxo-dGTP pyrophosphatase MutT (NUDIX family)